jgi:hypothetical protein
MVVCWIVGAPGVGKTTLVRKLANFGFASYVESPKWTLCGDVFAVGHYVGGTHDGGDTVPYNGAADAIAYWHERLAGHGKLTVLDGDRFASRSSVQQIGPAYKKVVIHLGLSDQMLDERRASRGTTQNPVWCKGRKTKAKNFAELFPEKSRLMLDATMSVDELASLVKAFLEEAESDV